MKKQPAERRLYAEMEVRLDDEAQRAAGHHRHGDSQSLVSMALKASLRR